MPRALDHPSSRRYLVSATVAAVVATVAAAGVGGAATAVAPAGSQPEGAADAASGVESGGIIAVPSRQEVTVDGRFDSLQAVIEELCEKSGVELRDYGATDRPIIAHYQALPLRKILRRLLSEESFALGMAKDPEAARAKITWVRVVGSSVARGRAPAAARPSRPVVLPRSGYTSASAAVRRRAAVSFAGRLNRDEALKNDFLHADNNALVGPMMQQRFADDFLRQLRGAATDRRIQLKIGQLQATLRRRNR